jgi:hypothetical protein
MRKVSILSLGIAAAVGMMAIPGFAATLSGNDLPDVRLGVGQSGDNVINLNQFFNADGDISYNVSGGGSVSVDGVLSVDGGAVAGKSSVTVTAQAGGDSVDKTLTVYVNDFSIGNIAIDNNNRIAGVAASGIFYNGIVPGSTVNGSGLTIPAVGGGSPAGTSAAALITSIADVSLDVDAAGFARRSASVVATGEGTASAGGLTVTLNADGSYSLVTTSDFSGDWVVTLGVSVGGNVDGVSLLAAQAANVDLSAAGGFTVIPAGALAAAPVAFAAGGATVTAGAGQGSLIVSNTAVDVGDLATISAMVNTSSTGVNIAVVAFDGALGGALYYTNPTGSNLQANADKNIALTCAPLTGKVLPAIQVANGGSAAATVTIKSLQVVMAGSVVDYALNPNATVALPVDGSIPSVDGWGSDLLQNGAAAATFSSENNFAAGAGSGSLSLDASAGATAIAQGYLMGINASEGTVVAESHVKKVSGDAGTYAMVLLNGSTFDCGAFPGGADIPSDNWAAVQTSGTASGGLQGGIFVAQSSGGLSVLVDDVSVRVVNDSDAWFDASLLGM